MKSPASEPGLRRPLLPHPTVSVRVNCIVAVFNKQLLDEVEHDIMNYQNRGLCLRQIIQTRGFDNS